MLVIIQNNQSVKIDQIIPQFESLLIDYFSVKDPKARYINDTTQQSWDGWYRKYNPRMQTLARPFLQKLQEFCNKYNIPLSIKDDRPYEKYPIDGSDIKDDMLHGITLEPHQMRVLKTICDGKHECGLISVVTGGGKTELMAAITKLMNLPTVIIADQRIVIEQIKERLELRDITDSAGKDSIGLFYGGETPDGQTVVVGSIQSLTSPPASLRKKKPKQYRKRKENAKLFQDIVGHAKLLLADECDKATDNRYRKLFKNYYNGRYKFGFSGTCFDPKKPVEALKLREYLGSVIVEVSRRELEDIGRIVPIRALMISVGDPADRYDMTAYDIAQRELVIDSPEYYDRIKKIVSAYRDEKTMILVDTHNIEDLGKALEREIEGSIFIFGKSSKKARNEAIRTFQDGKLTCLIGSKILKRGLDIKGGLDNLIICGGGKLSSDFDQKIGRAVRQNDRGWARLICFFHLDNHYLYKHSKEQLKTILSLGYKCHISFGKYIMDGEELVRRNFRLPKGFK